MGCFLSALTLGFGLTTAGLTAHNVCVEKSCWEETGEALAHVCTLVPSFKHFCYGPPIQIVKGKSGYIVTCTLERY